MRLVRLALTAGVLVGLLLTVPSRASAQQGDEKEFKAEFLRLCDLACRELNREPRRPPRHKAFYADSYAVRALAAAYDMTRREEYLQACKTWSDRMVDYQQKMIPKGAYYMNYGRKPGETKGDWYVADSSSIAMGVLATAVRCRNPKDRERYLDSVKAFAKLVMDNYVGPGGGITDGLWRQYDGEWWCSSGIFASLGFLLYEETGDEAYRKVALETLDWLNKLEVSQVKHISFEAAAPAVLMYVLEAYSAGATHLEPGTERRRAAVAQIAKALKWMAGNQQGRGAENRWDYNSQWGSKLGGLPFHMIVYARHLDEFRGIDAEADRELRHVRSVLAKDQPPALSQLAVFALMSYAEKAAPGAIYRSSRTGLGERGTSGP